MASREQLANELNQIRIALGRVAAYEGLDTSPTAMLVDELVRDHEELEARIDAAVMVLKQLIDNPPSPVDRAMVERHEEIARLLKGGSRVPDTPEDLEGI